MEDLKQEKKVLKFPEGFLWGAATSAHQVEGGNHNDWSEWEKKNAEYLARGAKNKWQKWQQEKFPEMFDPVNYISGKTADHYNLYEGDFDIAKSLGHNAHRLSIEWSRIEPEEGKFDEVEIEHYRKVIKALRARGLEPFVTLYHWPLPLWLEKKGGWKNKKTPRYFEKYAQKVTESFAGDVKFWITINEPLVYATNSFLRGFWPPQYKNPVIYFQVVKNLIKAHKYAYHSIKNNYSNVKDVQVGIAKDNVYFEGIGFINKAIAWIIAWWWNRYFLDKIQYHQDFIGLNNYFHNKINYGFNKNENEKVSDMGWELYPEALYQTLKELRKYTVPIYVIENGLADADDSRRAWFIFENLKYMHRAIGDGVDVRGYLHWSLLDNFEWSDGFWPRFGLVEVDFKTQERKIRESAHEYAKICKSNMLELDEEVN